MSRYFGIWMGSVSIFLSSFLLHNNKCLTCNKDSRVRIWVCSGVMWYGFQCRRGLCRVWFRVRCLASYYWIISARSPPLVSLETQSTARPLAFSVKKPPPCFYQLQASLQWAWLKAVTSYSEMRMKPASRFLYASSPSRCRLPFAKDQFDPAVASVEDADGVE